jgi:hypothetical protein
LETVPWGNVPILKKVILAKPSKEVILPESTTLTKPKWVGGKMGIQNILPKY